MAVVLVYRGELVDLLRAGLGWGNPADGRRRLAWLLVLATIPGALAGFFLEDFFEALFYDARASALLLLGTAGLLVAGEGLGRRSLLRSAALLGWLGALLIGLAQAVAIAPGISRSGATIATGLMVGLSRQESARFSFLLSVPIILGASASQLLGLSGAGAVGAAGPDLLLGFAAAFVTGVLAIRGLIRYLSFGSLYPFALYVTLLSFLTLWLTG